MKHHPSAERLRLFQENLLEESEATAISDHVEGCESCQSILDDLPPFGEPGESIHAFDGESTGPQVDTVPPAGQREKSTANLHAKPNPALRYRSLRLLARGGLGAVYVAEDTELHREVALKEILEESADDPTSRGRFLLEAEITGRLEHPGVVPVYGLGQYPDGRPFYAMRFIQGDNLGESIKRFHEAERPGRDPGERSLAFRQLLRRFIDVCNAVAYAHSRGVLHRDLKPGNIMLGKYGETLVVDWGLAKALGDHYTSPEGDGQLLRPSSGSGVFDTRAGAVLGTPVFMSPEQARGHLSAMGPASDVYGLGATLHMLLTGKPPFAGTGAQELLRKVEHGEFASARQIKPDTPPALDAISRNAMSLRPADRYPSALNLAADIEHWLADEPVGVYPEPLAGRLRRWSRRHRTLVTGIAALLVTAVVALAIGLAAVDHQRRQTDRALQAETRAREAETQARMLAMGALRQLTDDVVDQQLARQTVLSDEDRRFLRDIQRQYEQFAALPGDDAEQRAIRAEGNLRSGVMQHRLGEEKEAEASYGEAVTLYRQLTEAFSDRPEFRQGLATSYHNLGAVLKDTGRSRQAEAAYADAVALFKQLVSDFPTRPDFRRELANNHTSLGILLEQTGRPKEAETALADALVLRKQLVADFPTRPNFRQELAKSHNNLGIMARATGRLKEAEAAYADSLALIKQLAADFPGRPEFREELAMIHHNMGTLLRATGRVRDAEAAFAQALALRKQLAADFPVRPEFREALGSCHHNLGNLLLETGRLKEAEAAFTEAFALRKQLVADFPRRPEFRRNLASSHNSLGVLLYNTGRRKEAEAAFADALALYKQMTVDFPSHSEYRQELARSYSNLGNVLEATRRQEQAAAAYADALALFKELSADFPETADYRNDLAATLVILADVANQRHDFAQAGRHLSEAEPHHQAALQANPRHPNHRKAYRGNIEALVISRAGTGDQAAALEAATRRRDLGWDPPADAYNAACALAKCVAIVEKNDQATAEGRATQAEFYAEQAVLMLKDAVAKGFKNAARMKKDTDLDSLRQREDFHKLLAELERE